MDEWVTVCAECLSPVKAAVFRIPAAAAYGATQDYSCEKCGHYGKAIEVTPKMLEKLAKQKELKARTPNKRQVNKKC